MADEMAQARSMLYNKWCVFLAEWEQANGINEIQDEQIDKYLTTYHEALGHVGYERIKKFLSDNKIQIKGMKK